ncbi:MAG TPA: hypothetical protein VHQ45_06615 [Gemmatimonadaceae bacterium]|nr:hypothetical protein [Gemmatimonadaceae bacterium]
MRHALRRARARLVPAALPLSVLMLALLTAPAARAQSRAVVPDSETHASSALLRQLLARPHRLIPTVVGEITSVPRHVASDRSLVAVDGDLAVAGRVNGDVIVVNGDLYLRPGANISGRAVAVGGAVYPSILSRVDSGVTALPDDSITVDRRGDLLVLGRRDRDRPPMPVFSLPTAGDVRLFGYTRVDGLVLPVALLVQTPDGRLVVEPRATYRSQLGTVDPTLAATFRVTPRLTLHAVAERGTYTNELWARGDLRNGVATFLRGRDVRNYYRASAASAELTLQQRAGAWTLSPSIGTLAERASSVGRRTVHGSVPFTLFGRDDPLGIRRPNPAVDEGDIVSGIAALRAERAGAGSRVRGVVRVELPFQAPGDSRFTQVIAETELLVPTLGRQSIVALVHGVHTFGDTPPAQRFHALGGRATISTLEAPVLTGDRLFYAAASYLYPLSRPDLPFVGAPVLSLRYAVGSAGVGTLPELVQNVGLQVGVIGLRVGVVVDPAVGDPQFDVLFSLTP